MEKDRRNTINKSKPSKNNSIAGKKNHSKTKIVGEGAIKFREMSRTKTNRLSTNANRAVKIMRIFCFIKRLSVKIKSKIDKPPQSRTGQGGLQKLHIFLNG